MRTVPAIRVDRVLRTELGLRKLSKGNGTGHTVYEDDLGRRCRPLVKKKDIPFAVLYSLGCELEAKGVCSRKEFMALIRFV